VTNKYDDADDAWTDIAELYSKVGSDIVHIELVLYLMQQLGLNIMTYTNLHINFYTFFARSQSFMTARAILIQQLRPSVRQMLLLCQNG